MSKPYINDQANKIGDITGTEIGYLDGLSGNAQTQFDGKQTKIVSSGILKGDGAGVVSTAVENTDFLSAQFPQSSGSAAFGGDVYANNGTVTQSVSTTVAALSRLSGDVDGNGAVNSIDALLVNQYIAGTATLTSAQKVAADINEDGKINEQDSTLILQRGSGLYTPPHAYATYAELSGIPKSAVINSISGIAYGAAYMIDDGIMAIYCDSIISSGTEITVSVTIGKKLATEEYVGTNGGKIDHIQLDGTEQTITNKTVNLPKSVFLATYGTTTYAQLYAAYTAGKEIIVQRIDGSITYYYISAGLRGSGALFGFVCLENGDYISCDSSYGWSVHSQAKTLQPIAAKVTSLSSSSTNDQYPSAKCVYEELADKYEKPSGGIPDSDITSAATWNAKQNAIGSSTDLTVKTLTGGLSYTTTAPTAANSDGIKIAVLSSEPSTKYAGWLYLITG